MFVFLLLLGLGVMLYPTVCDRYYRWKIQGELNEYVQTAESEQKDYSELWAAAEEYNRSLLEKEDPFRLDQEELDYVATLLNPLGTGMMGYLDIPKINVRIPIYQGTEESVLQSGAGWWIGTSLPTGGESTHCVITAHNGLVKARLFTDLDQLEEGDRFTLSVLDRSLTYEVDQILVTEPDEFEPLQIVDGADYVTLYTCTPYGVNTHRLLVRGRRVETAAGAEHGASAEGGAQQAGLSWWKPALAALAALLGLSLLLLGLALLRTKRRHGKREAQKEKQLVIHSKGRDDK